MPGKTLKPIPEGNKGLGKLSKEVRNQIGFMKRGGKVEKMKHGGQARGMGAAVRGGKFTRNG